MNDKDKGKGQDGPGYDGSEARLTTDANHKTTPFADDRRRPAPSDYRNPNMGPGPGGHPGPSGKARDKAPEEHPDQHRDADATREALGCRTPQAPSGRSTLRLRRQRAGPERH